MYIYKLTCSKSGGVYYGATKNTPGYRVKKGGHITCSCKDFINPIIEIVEKVEKLEDLFTREKYYIRNFECVNKQGKILDRVKAKREYDKEYSKQYRKKNKSKLDAINKKQLIQTKCNLCKRNVSKKNLTRHQSSKLCIKSLSTDI